MIETKIDGVLLSAYRAHLLDYEIGDCDYKNGYILPPSSIFPVKVNHNVGLRKIVLKIDFEGDSMHEIEMNISNMTAALHGMVDILLPDGFSYFTAFESASTPTKKAPWILQVKFTLSGIRHEAKITESTSVTADDRIKVFTIDVKGNCKTPATIIIKPSVKGGVSQGGVVPKPNFTIAGIKLTGVEGPVIIDGISKTITENGVNAFEKSDMTAFPELMPGKNDISIIGSGTVKIEYYPIFV